MGGHGSQAFLGQECTTEGPVRPVVMVFLPEEMVSNKELFEQIVEETKIAVCIDHRNVIGVHGLARLDEGYARIVEYADGESLRSIFHRAAKLGRRVPPRIATGVMAPACMGVHYAHELGLTEAGKPLLHGGLRPETILVGFHGQAKVTGYGAALIAEATARARGADSSIRDPYTAPEQIFGGRKAAHMQTDVYALGAVLYELLTAKPPFGQDASLSEAITSKPPEADFPADVSNALINIVLRAMEKRAPDRYESALDMRQELLALPEVADEAEIATFMEELFPPTTPQRMARAELLEKGKDTRANPSGNTVVVSEETVARQGTPPATARQAPPPARSGSAARGRLAAGAPADSPPLDPRYLDPEATDPVIRVTQPVVYRSHPALYIALSVLATIVVLGAVGAYFFLRSPAPVTPPVAQPAPIPPPVQPPPDPGPAAQPTPAPEPAKPQKPGSSKPRRPPRQTPAASADAKGELIISTDPEMDVFIDGKKVGNGHVTVRVQPGSRQVQARDPSSGMKVSRRVRVGAGESEAVFLEAKPGSLYIDAPAGSEVFVDGKLVGTAPVDGVSLNAGPHKVKVKQQGTNVQYNRTVDVKAGLDLTMTVQFYNE